jgi:hypothetical protein
MNARLIGLTAGLMLAVMGMGLVTPPKAQANDAGKILLGVAAGALIAGLIDSSRDCEHDRYRYCRPPVVVYDYGYRDDGRWRDRDDHRWSDRDHDRGRWSGRDDGHDRR